MGLVPATSQLSPLCLGGGVQASKGALGPCSVPDGQDKPLVLLQGAYVRLGIELGESCQISLPGPTSQPGSLHSQPSGSCGGGHSLPTASFPAWLSAYLPSLETIQPSDLACFWPWHFCCCLQSISSRAWGHMCVCGCQHPHRGDTQAG